MTPNPQVARYSHLDHWLMEALTQYGEPVPIRPGPVPHVSLIDRLWQRRAMLRQETQRIVHEALEQSVVRETQKPHI